MEHATVEDGVADLASPEATAPVRTRRRKGRGGRIAVVLVLLALAGAATGLGFGGRDQVDRLAAALGIGGRESADDKTPSGLPPSTATVTRQTLRDTETADGELGYGTATTVTSRQPGTITYLPDSGSQVKRGEALYKVDNKPVTLMYGAMPAYRTLAEGVEGPDVKQLEQNLRALGYQGFTVDEEYSSGTADAVREWQEDLGLDETGVVEVGAVVFAPAAVRVDSLEVSRGELVGARQGVLRYTGTAKVVTVELEPADQRLAGEGTTVGVTLPDGTALTGRVTDVATVIQPASGQNQEPQTRIEVTVALADQQAADAYALASVDVTFTAEERKDVLTVPVAALLALPGGGFGVEVVADGTSRYVPVETGLFAAGRVEISGAGIVEGTTVGVPK